MKVTDEHIYDSKMLPEWADQIIDSNNMTTTIGKLFADGVYDGNDVFRCLGDNGMLICKVRKNSRFRLKKETYLETYQFWPGKMICKDGRISV